MLVELPKEKYSLLFSIKEFNLFPIVASVIYQKQQGKIFVDNTNDPKTVYVVHKSGFSYLYSEKEIDYDLFLKFLYDNDSTPQYSHIYNAPDALVAHAAKATIVNIKAKRKMRMNGHAEMQDLANLDLKEYTVKSVDKVDVSQLAVFNLNFIEKFWSSVDDFIKNGFGWVLFDGDKPACIWYSAALVNGNSETDLLTLPEYRGKGLASILGVYIINTCAEKGINMDWDVITDNIPSIKIAERYGYTPYFEYNLLSVFKNK